MFGSASRQSVIVAMGELRARSGGDLLRVGPGDFAAVALALDDRARDHLLDHLMDAAILSDCDRLIAAAESFGRANVPPARLIADWAISIGADPDRVARIAASAEAPVRLVTAYLRGGRLDRPEAMALSDVAAAYTGDRALANGWIRKAVEREVDRYTELVRAQRPRAGAWQRLCTIFLKKRSLTNS